MIERMELGEFYLGTSSTTIKNPHICELVEGLWIALPIKISLA